MTNRQRGRPRNPDIDDAILEATRSLLVEIGYAATSIDAVAARARVSKPTLYLRYPSKGVLVFAAVFGQTRKREMPDSGDVGADLCEAYDWFVAEIAGAEARSAVPGLLAELSSNKELARTVRSRIIEPEYARVHALLERAQARGEVRTDADLTLVTDVFLGTALARVAVLDHAVDHQFSVRLVELLLSGLAPRPGAGS